MMKLGFVEKIVLASMELLSKPSVHTISTDEEARALIGNLIDDFSKEDIFLTLTGLLYGLQKEEK